MEMRTFRPSEASETAADEVGTDDGDDDDGPDGVPAWPRDLGEQQVRGGEHRAAIVARPARVAQLAEQRTRNG
jgi:hypothetical protein